MMVDKLATLIVVSIVAELFRDDQPQDEPAPLSTISLPSSLLVSLLEVSGLGILVGLTSLVATPTFNAPPLLLSLIPITVLLVVEQSSVV